MAKNKERILEIGIDELRRTYDGVSDAYRQIKTKALGLLAGEVAILTFIFSASASNSGFTPPYLVHEAVLFLSGILCVIISFIAFLSVVSPVKWNQPPEINTIENLGNWFDDDPIKFMENLKMEYIKSINHCIRNQSGKSIRFKIGLYTLCFGVAILTLLKFGGGTINL